MNPGRVDRMNQIAGPACSNPPNVATTQAIAFRPKVRVSWPRARSSIVEECSEHESCEADDASQLSAEVRNLAFLPLQQSQPPTQRVLKRAGAKYALSPKEC